LLALAASLASLHAAWAVHAAIGTMVSNPQMPALGGGSAPALGDGTVNVLVFFRPAQENSTTALHELARCQTPFAGKPVRWAGVVSGSAPTTAAAALARDSGFSGPVLVDEGDAFYGSLGLALHPVVVIVDRKRALAAFEPYRAVNFCAVVGAQLRHVLGEISDAELNAALEPPAPLERGNGQAARSQRSLAEALYKAGNYDKAAVYARKSVAADPQYADAHALLGEILRAQGNCTEALAAYDATLALDGGNTVAREGRARCAAPP
jgi:hypothetical protein